MELVRNILLELEKQDDFRNELKIPDEDPIKVVYHLKIMEQAGLVEKNIKYASNEPLWIYASITWEGHEFLSSIKNDTIWKKLMSRVKEEGQDIALSILIKLAYELAKNEYL